ncbi:MAG: hypothetical protein G01um101416_494 [Microgenomates group bacterium Gr01-1014_16]|nr:MAG: hypothetical protein G01um101416_494 [Microgenomates group bacterium Gr01-1014_16]
MISVPAPKFDYGKTHVIDSTPSSNVDKVADFADAGWPMGKKFTDSLYGVSITPVSKAADGTLVVDVSFASTAPTLSFSSLTSTLNGVGNATFNFVYQDVLDTFYVDVATDSIMKSNLMVEFGKGTASPIVVTDSGKWTGYKCWQTVYWRVRAASGGVSPVQQGQVTCPALVDKPTNGSPNAQLVTTNSRLGWGGVAGATSNNVQVSISSIFGTTLINSIVTDTQLAYNLAGEKAYYWRVKGKRVGVGDGPWSDTWSFTTVSTPTTPVLQTPVNLSLVTDDTPDLNWTDSTPTPAYYQLEYSTDPSFFPGQTVGGSGLVTIAVDVPGATSAYTIPTALARGQTYYWRVRAVNKIVIASAWSSTFNFRLTLSAPTGLTVNPVTGSTALTTRPTFGWNKVAAAAGYTIQVSSSSTFASTVIPVVNATVAGENTISYVPTVDLTPKGTSLYWRVRSNHAAYGPSVWSATGTFISANPPGVLVLLGPANGSAAAPLYSTAGIGPHWYYNFSWVASTNSPTKYQLQISDTNTFSSLKEDRYITATATPKVEINLGQIYFNKTYYWRVRSYNAAGQYSLWSSVWSFRIPFAGPILTTPGNTTTYLHSLRPEFTWQVLTGATEYKLQISTVSSFASMILDTTLPVGNVYSPSPPRYPADYLAADLPRGVYIYWRVQGIAGVNGAGPWSTTWNFKTNSAIPSTVVTMSPKDLQSVSYPVVLTWGASSPTPKEYMVDVYYDEPAPYTGVFLVQSKAWPGLPGTTTTFTVTNKLSTARQGGVFRWRVRAYNSAYQNSESVWAKYKCGSTCWQ